MVVGMYALDAKLVRGGVPLKKFGEQACQPVLPSARQPVLPLITPVSPVFSPVSTGRARFPFLPCFLPSAREEPAALASVPATGTTGSQAVLLLVLQFNDELMMVLNVFGMNLGCFGDV